MRIKREERFKILKEEILQEGKGKGGEMEEGEGK